MGLFRIVYRFITFIRIAILARILTPTQFGIFGIASIILAFLEIFTETGINVFIIQKKEPINKYINTAWVISIFRGIFISLLILISARKISIFFNNDNAYPIILLIAIVPLIRGFINPSIVKLQKDLLFNKEFRIRSLIFFADSLVAVITAIILRSASALVYGFIAGATIEVILSFVFIKPRPRFKFIRKYANEIIGKGKWVTTSVIFSYLSQQGDDVVVGKILNATSLGFYQVAYRISTLPLTEVTQLTSKVTFPVYVRITSDIKRLKKAFIKTGLITSAFIIPFGIILYLFPETIIKIFLGPKWLEASEILRVLAIFGIFRAIMGVPNSLFLSLNKQKWVAAIHTLQFIGLIITVIPLTYSFGIVGAGYSSIFSVIVTFPVIIYYLQRAFINEKK